MEILDRQKRYAEIATLAAQHDLGFVFDRVGLSSLVPERFKGRDPEHPGLTDPERVRRLFEALGPTFVKMGQILSTRPDLLPRPFLLELKQLQDNVSMLPFEVMRPVAEEELGAPLEEVFAEIDTEALAAASIGQVYRVTLLDGTRAVVKIQRPAIEEIIRTDLSILRAFASLAKKTGLAAPLDPVAIIQVFEQTILRELDYVTEGRETDAFRAQHADDPELLVPAVFWETTGKRVLTLELIEGVKVSEVARLREAGQDLPRVAKKLVDTILSQVLLLDRFHADPHPGNLLVTEDGRLALIDFGMAGGFDRTTRRALVDLLQDISQRDAKRLAQHLLEHGFVDYDADLRKISAEVREMFKALSGGAALPEVMEAFIRFVVTHNLAFPPDLFFLDKVFGTLDGAVKTLDPKLSMRALAAEFVPTMAKGMAKDLPELTKELLLKLLAADDALLALPAELRRVLQRADAGHLRVVSQQEPSPALVRTRARRLAAASLTLLGIVVITGALFVPDVGVPTLAAGAIVFALGFIWLCLQGRD